MPSSFPSKLFARQDPGPPQIESQQLLHLVPHCAVCDEALPGHKFVTLAEASPSDFDGLNAAVLSRDWPTVTAIRSFIGNKDTLSVKAIACGDRGFLVTLYDEWALEAVCFVRSSEVLDPVEWGKLRTSFDTNDWKTVLSRE